MSPLAGSESGSLQFCFVSSISPTDKPLPPDLTTPLAGCLTSEQIRYKHVLLCVWC